MDILVQVIMCQMLLSINPEFVTSILQGKKLYEYRKFRCRSDVDKIIIYATAPQKQVVGEAEIFPLSGLQFKTLWENIRESSPAINLDFFITFYNN